MNKRIKELAEQTDKWASEEYHQLFLENINPDRQELFNKKFAELIVRECITVIENEMPEFNCKEEFDNLIRKDGRLDAIDEIKDHFGYDTAWGDL